MRLLLKLFIQKPPELNGGLETKNPLYSQLYGGYYFRFATWHIERLIII